MTVSIETRFQLGLLLLSNARVEEALAVWAPLDQLPDSNPYLHFKRGLASLCHDDFLGCKESLRRGIQLNTVNAALNTDMERVLDDIQRQATPPGAEPSQNHVLLSSYTQRS